MMMKMLGENKIRDVQSISSNNSIYHLCRKSRYWSQDFKTLHNRLYSSRSMLSIIVIYLFIENSTNSFEINAVVLRMQSPALYSTAEQNYLGNNFHTYCVQSAFSRAKLSQISSLLISVFCEQNKSPGDSVHK